jgi:hypothetical protein
MKRAEASAAASVTRTISSASSDSKNVLQRAARCATSA